MANPESFIGTYQIVYMGEALQSFFNDIDADFGPLNPPDDDELLIDHLPLVKSGWLLRNTLLKLLYIYFMVNNLAIGKESVFSDKVMMSAFGGDIPAAFYIYKDEEPQKIRMQFAIDNDLIMEPLNIYDSIKTRDPDFNPYNFWTFYTVNIMALDAYTKKDLNEDPDPLYQQLAEEFNDETLKHGLLQEYYIVDNAYQHWIQIKPLIDNLPY